MNHKLKNSSFSLTEILLSMGILAVGVIFIAGAFTTAIRFTTITTERTIAAIVADEAFAKIKIYAMGGLADPRDNIDLNKLAIDELRDFNDIDIFPATAKIEPNEFTYPSDPKINISQKQYCWSALCRQVGADPNRLVQVTVFVSRKVGSHLQYYRPDPSGSGEVSWPTPHTFDWPVPVKVAVRQGSEDNKLEIEELKERDFINDGSTIVDDRTGRIYRVLERYTSPDNTILLDRDWDDSPPGDSPDAVWVVPPPVNGNRYPCIAIYQKVIRF